MTDLNLLKAEAERWRTEGLNNRQLTVKLAEMLSYRFGERPTQALIMDVLRDREAGKCPSASTIQAGLKDFESRQAQRHQQGTLGPATWPEEIRAEATALLINLDGWARQQSDRVVQTVRQESDESIRRAREEAEDRRRDQDLALARASAAEAEARQAQAAREVAEKLLAEARVRNDGLESNIHRMEQEVQRLRDAMESQRHEAAKEKTELQAAQERKLGLIMDQHQRDRDGWQSEVSHLEQLLTASDETIKRLRLELQREVDLSDGMRKDLEKMRKSLQTATDETFGLKALIAGHEARAVVMQRELDRVRKPVRSGAKLAFKRRLAK